MYKVSPDDVGDMHAAVGERTLPELYKATTAFLFRHAGPAFNRAQLIEQIRDAKVYDVDKREAMLWREIIRSCHPSWEARVQQKGFSASDSISCIVGSMPANEDTAGWRKVANECIEQATLTCDDDEKDAAVAEVAGTSAAGSLQSLVDSTGAYSETMESLLAGAINGYGEAGTVNTGIVNSTQSAVTESTLADAAKALITIKSPAQIGVNEPHVILQNRVPVNEFKECSEIDSKVHPYLIYNGGGSPRDLCRFEQYNPKEMFKYENTLMYRAYAWHPTRNFYTCDVITRHTDARNARFVIEKRDLGLCLVSTGELKKYSDSIRRGIALPPAEMMRINKFRRQLKIIGRMRKGSQYDRLAKKGQLDAYDLTIGTANVFYTINMSEGRDPRVSIILGIIDADGIRHVVTRMLPRDSVTTAEQIIAVARDPYRVAEWYDLMLDSITGKLLVPSGSYNDTFAADESDESGSDNVGRSGTTVEGASGDGVGVRRVTRGILGTLVAYYGVNENGLRMGSHTHLKAWLAEMRFVQRATQENDVTLRDMEFALSRFVESLSTARLFGHDDKGEVEFSGTDGTISNVMHGVDAHELSFCDAKGFNVLDSRQASAPSPAELHAHVAESTGPGVSLSTEAAFGTEWSNRVTRMAVDRAAQDPLVGSGVGAIDAVSAQRRAFVSPRFTGASRDRNDVDHTTQPVAPRPAPFRGKVHIRSLGRGAGPVLVGEFELECHTVMSRVEIQACLHGTRKRTFTDVENTAADPGVDRTLIVRRECTPCCHKTREAKKRQTCRLRFGPDGRAIVEFTYFDNQGVPCVVRNHGHLVPHSKTGSIALRCNTRFVLLNRIPSRMGTMNVWCCCVWRCLRGGVVCFRLRWAPFLFPSYHDEP